jgi:hypothetical protein
MKKIKLRLTTLMSTRPFGVKIVATTVGTVSGVHTARKTTFDHESGSRSRGLSCVFFWSTCTATLVVSWRLVTMARA